MNNQKLHVGDIAIRVFSVIALLIISGYSYIYLFVDASYRGLIFDPNNGDIEYIFLSDNYQSTLEVGDYLVKVGDITFESYLNNRNQPLFGYQSTGEKVPVIAQRNGATFETTWTMPGFNQIEFFQKLTSQWSLSFVFWISGVLALMLIRPLDLRARLLAAFNFLTGIWLASGTLSYTHLYYSSLVLHIGVWFCIPVYWHFHWNFPQSLRREPKWLFGSLYSLAMLAGIGEVFQVLPITAYALGFVLAVLGSVVLLLLHLVVSKNQRRELGQFILLTGILLVPSIFYSSVLSIQNASISLASTMMVLPALPIAYLLVIYRKQLGGMQLRANRALILLIYFFLLIGFTIFLSLMLPSSIMEPDISKTTTAILVVLISALSVILFPSFERWAERTLLRMPLPPTRLVEAYTEQIATSLDEQKLVELLREEILPSLLIRQAAILRTENPGKLAPIMLVGINEEQQPGSDNLDRLLAEAGKFRPPVDGEVYPWIRLILPLKVEGKTTGVCLLGRRDPDDIYALNEIPMLQVLIDHTALALKNIEQAQELHALYQNDIQKQESYRAGLARELHDGVLGEMAIIAQYLGDNSRLDVTEAAYHSAVDRVRTVISELRPSMLMYGLRYALEELADNTMDLTSEKVIVQLSILPSQVRLPELVELHLYRIIQQACQNAIQHGKADHILLAGRIEQDFVDVILEDNGCGFEAGENINLASLLAKRHFGLAGMYERANFVGAEIYISSSPGEGTCLHVKWQPSSQD